jgi:F0F1-type ATP synthase assembly protein I
MTDEPGTSRRPAEPSRGDTRPGAGPSASVYASAGLQFAISILVFLFAGQWADRRLGTGPWLMMIGLFLGAGASFYSMYKKLMAATEAEERAARERRERERGSAP